MGPVATDCDWLIGQLEALYAHDERGRITTRRDPGASPAARFHLGRTPHGNLWRIRCDVPEPLVRRLSRLAAREPALPPGGPPWADPERAAPIRAALDAVEAVREAWSGRVFRLPSDAGALESIAAHAVGSEILDPSEADARAALGVFLPHVAASCSERSPVVVSRESGEIASACYGAVGSPGAFVEAGVDTLPAWRRRGHASRAVAGWLVAVRRLGGVPLYSARDDDGASLGVAAGLGLEAFADTLHFT